MLNRILIALVLGLILIGNVSADQKTERPKGEYVFVEMQGKIQTGIAAIGGETTGVIISSKGVTWELELGKNQDLRKLATKLNGKMVKVTGYLTVRRGVEIRQRSIVTVKTLQATKK